MIMPALLAVFLVFVGLPLMMAGVLWGLLKIIDHYLPLNDYDDDGDDDGMTEL